MRLSPNTPAQYAMAEGLENSKEHGRTIMSMVRQIEDRANFATKLINNSSYMKTVRPKGAYYILPRVHLDKLKIGNDREFVDKLLKEEFVQITRGSGFEARDHVRIVTLPTKDILESAITKINEFCRRHKK